MRITAPNRVTRTYTQRLKAAPSRVFPLLCPVREAEWIAGWDPVAVYTNSGVAEPDCVFVTRADPHNSVWYITRHEPAKYLVEMIKVTPEVTACKVTIRVRAALGGSEAEVTYSQTSLGPLGDKVVADFTEEHYARFMQAWEEQMNHFLEYGSALPEAAG